MQANAVIDRLADAERYLMVLRRDAIRGSEQQMMSKSQDLGPGPIITIALGFGLVFAINYTIGQLIATLAMIEPSSPTTITEPVPVPAYTDNSEADPLVPDSELEPRNVEANVLFAPVTNKITTSVRHLRRIRGLRSCWRGLFYGLIYSLIVSLASTLSNRVFGNFGLFATSLFSILFTFALARLHMCWTHAMIAAPKPFAPKWKLRALVPWAECKPLWLPALIHSVAMQLTMVVPQGMAYSMGLLSSPSAIPKGDTPSVDPGSPEELSVIGLKFLAVVAVYALVGLFLQFPASILLTRIEATLLPDQETTVVAFDKAAIIGDIDGISSADSYTKFLRPALESFDRACRWRVIKLYVKLFLIQIVVMAVVVVLIVLEAAFAG